MTASTDFVAPFQQNDGETLAADERSANFDAPVEATEAKGRTRIAVADAGRGRVLKYKADRLPVAFVLLKFAAHVAVWALAGPWVAVALMIPLTILSMFVAAINHHHQHLNTFRSSVLNRIYDITLALQAGVAPYSWVLHHNFGHHVNYLNQHPHPSPDESAWTRRDGEQMTRVEYTLDMLLRHQADIYQVGLRYPRYMKYWLAMKLPLYAVIGVMLWVNPLNTVIVFLVPGFIALTHTIWVTYDHHAGCETHDHLVGSMNCENPLFNFLTCNLGFHTAHHKRPGVHWSLLPQVHDEIRDGIPEHLMFETFWKVD